MDQREKVRFIFHKTRSAHSLIQKIFIEFSVRLRFECRVSQKVTDDLLKNKKKQLQKLETFENIVAKKERVSNSDILWLQKFYEHLEFVFTHQDQILGVRGEK